MVESESKNGSQGFFINVNRMDMYFRDYGSGRPLILLHGGTASSNSWKTDIPTFSPHFRVITPDIRGHGKSNNPSGEFSYKLLADDIAEFIQALNLNKPFIFGYSDGGQIALEIGVRYPGLTGAMAIGAASYKFSDSYFAALRSEGFESPGQVDSAKILSESPGYVEFLKTEHVFTEDPEYWQTLLRQISFMWLTPVNYSEKELNQMSEPALIILGDRDNSNPVEMAVEMYRLIPSSELAILPNGTHGSINEKMMNEIVLDFLIRHTVPAGEG